MKKTYLALTSVLLVAIALLFQSNANGPASNGNRATGAPGDGGSTCVSCHSGGSFGTVIVDLQLFDSNGDTVFEYVPGSVYDVSVGVSSTNGSPSAYGFQMISMSGSSSLNSFSSPGSGVKLSTSNSRQYAEHNAPKSTGVFSVQWTAPAQGTGDVKFYFGANAVNGNGNNGSDNAVVGNVVFAEIASDTTDTTSGEVPEGLIDLARNQITLSIYPNPAREIVFVKGNSANGIVNVYSVNGTLVKSAALYNNQFNVSDLEAGIYFIQADSQLGSFVKL